MEAAEDLFRLAHEGSDEARSRIIRENAGLVRMMAYRLGGGHGDLEDLIQWGQIGLIQAVDRFNPSYGSRFLPLLSLISREKSDAVCGKTVP